MTEDVIAGGDAEQADTPEQQPQTAAPKGKPPAYTNKQRQLEIFKTVRRQSVENRAVFERKWWQILNYLLRRQWIYLDTKRGQWRDKRLAKWMPRPTTAKLNEIQTTLRSMFGSIELGAIARPNGNDPLNITTSEVADGLEPLLKEEHDFDTVTRDADFWLTALGNVILHPWWDADRGESIMVPESRCADCGLVYPPGTVDLENPECESCGGVNILATPGTEVPIAQGSGCTDVCSPLEILVPSGYQNWKDVRELIRARWRTKSHYEANYPHLVSQIKWEKTPKERSLQLMKALASQSDLSTTPYVGAGSEDGDSEGVVEYEMWIKPTEEFPEGYVGRFVGEGEDPIIIEDEQQSLPGPIPYRDQKGKALWNWIHIGYDTFGGRLWAAGPMEPLLPLVDKLNRLDARIELTVDRMSNPVWLEPKGAEVERLTGEPGIVVRYHALGTGGIGKPERIEGQNVPQSLFQLRMQYVQDIEDAAGTQNVLKGERPVNVDTFSGMQLLAEMGQKRFTVAFKERGRAYQEWYTLALEMERSFGPPERTMSVLGPNRTWAFEVFKKADLSGSVTIVVEDGSTVPKTALGKRAAIDHANQLKLIDAANPEQVYAIMSHLGLKDLVPQIDKSVSAVQREQYLYEKWVASGRVDGPNPLIRIDYVDDDPVHVVHHRMWATSDAIRDLMLTDPQAMMEIQLHIFEHENGAFQKQAAMGMAAAPPLPPGPPQGGAPGGGQALTSSNNESANPADQSGAANPIAA